MVRSGKEVKSIDLYDYFVNGKLDYFSLKDQDVIIVPTYNKRIFLNGEFKNTGMYEALENDNILDILNYSGGVNSFGYKNQLFVKRTEGLGKKINSILVNDYGNYSLEDGDIIEARPVNSSFNNSVLIEGDVRVAGEYSIESSPDVKALINQSGGLRNSAFKDRAYIFRMSNGVYNEVLTVDLKAVMDGAPILLEPNDKLIISSNNDLERERNVDIRGQVFEPDNYPYFDGITLIDLILMAKGTTLLADLNNIEIYRSTYDKTRVNPVKGIKVSLDGNLNNMNSESNIELMQDDLVIVRKKEGVQKKEFVFVDGLVKTPGGYSIQNNNYSFFDLIKDFGGFLPDASLEGVKIRRKIQEVQLSESSLIEKDSIILKTKKNMTDDGFIEFGVNIDKIITTGGKDNRYNIVLKNGDQVKVPKVDNSIEISGQIQQPSVLTFSNSLSIRGAINRSGGFKEGAKRNSVYVVYQNGNIASTKNFLFFKNYPKLKPGSKIVVPKKDNITEKTSVAEIVGYTTSLVSIIALLKSL